VKCKARNSGGKGKLEAKSRNTLLALPKRKVINIHQLLGKNRKLLRHKMGSLNETESERRGGEGAKLRRDKIAEKFEMKGDTAV